MSALLLQTNYFVNLNIFQKRWAQKEQEVREEMKRARLGPSTSELCNLQGKINVAPLIVLHDCVSIGSGKIAICILLGLCIIGQVKSGQIKDVY